MLDNEEFKQIVNALDSTRDYLIQQRRDIVNRIWTLPQTEMLKIKDSVVNDCSTVASMVSRLLDSDELSLSQRVVLKASLSLLEHEIRLLRSTA